MPLNTLDITSPKRGEWHVVAQPTGLRVTVHSLPNKKAAAAARDAIASGVLFPWDVSRDGLKAAMDIFREAHGMPLSEAVARTLAAVPAADPQGWNAGNVRSMDAGRAAHAAFVASEEADGYTEVVKLDDIGPGDEISFKYTVLRSRYGFDGMADLGTGPGSARTVVVRGTVTGEGRLMDRSGNNYHEGVSGLRFPLEGATWRGDDGSGGALTAAVTTDWLYGARRRPRKG